MTAEPASGGVVDPSALPMLPSESGGCRCADPLQPPCGATGQVEQLIDASSLGTPEAVALRASVPDEVGWAIVARSKEIGEEGRAA